MQQAHMSLEDAALCQQAIGLANAGDKMLAYDQFVQLYYRYPQDVTLLYWLAFTTPSMEEAQRAIGDIARIQPNHPKLYELRQYVDRMQESSPYALRLSNIGPVLRCPYCGHVGPVRIAKKTSPGGWILFVIILLIFFPLCWIGLLIQKDVYACASCGIALGDRPY